MRVVTWNVNGLRPFAKDPSAADAVAESVGGADLLALQEAKLTAAQLTRGTDGRFAQRIACLPRPGQVSNSASWSACLSLHPQRGYAGVVSYARASPVRAAEGLTPHPPPTSAPIPVPIPATDYAQSPRGTKVWCGCAGLAPDGSPRPVCPRLAALLQLDPAMRTAPPSNIDSEGRALVTVHRIRPALDTHNDLPSAVTLFNIYAPNETRSDRVPFKLSFYTALTRAVAAAAASPAPPMVVGDLNVIASSVDKAWSDEWPKEIEQAALDALGQGHAVDLAGNEELPVCPCCQDPKENEWCWCSIGMAAYRAAVDAAPRAPSPRPGRTTTSSSEERSPQETLPYWLGALLSRAWFHSLTRGSNPLVHDMFEGAHSEASRFTCWSVKFDLRRANFGCRLDYILAHPTLAECGIPGVSGSVAEVLDAQGSDHAPVSACFAFEFTSIPLSSDEGQDVHPWLAPDLRLLPANWPAFQRQGTIEAMFAQAPPSTEGSPSATPISSSSLRDATTRKKPRSSATRQLSMKSFISRARPSSQTQVRPRADPPLPASRLPPADPLPIVSEPISTGPGNADAQRAWSQLLSAKPRPAPLCHHGEPAKQARVSKAGRNKGRTFWFCARPIALGPGAVATPPSSAASKLGPTRCSFFRWDSK